MSRLIMATQICDTCQKTLHIKEHNCMQTVGWFTVLEHLDETQLVMRSEPIYHLCSIKCLATWVKKHENYKM
jgi:adenosyl cobinamide kinase/adenosyl cobinamide phosphate guanylyltransferase